MSVDARACLRCCAFSRRCYFRSGADEGLLLLLGGRGGLDPHRRGQDPPHHLEERRRARAEVRNRAEDRQRAGAGRALHGACVRVCIKSFQLVGFGLMVKRLVL